MTYQVIYIDELGNIEKVTDKDGKEIPPHKDAPDPKELKDIAKFHTVQRCTYGANGNCYCR